MQAIPRTLGPGAATGALAGFTTALRDPSDYAGRGGYVEDFVEGVVIPMPKFKNGFGDVAVVDCPDRPGQTVYDLRYTHFSTSVSISRKMPFFSCVNIDGTKEKVLGRRNIDWRYDPRIDTTYQILSDGIYGRA